LFKPGRNLEMVYIRGTIRPLTLHVR
jgi:hypothetical protein